MTGRIGLAAAGAAVLLAGCAASTRTVYVQHTPAQQSAAPSHASSATSAARQAAGNNEREFADGLASANSLIPSSVVAGPVMHAYRMVQHELNQGDAAAGQPDSAETVTEVPGGYQLCAPDTGNGSHCDVLTNFTTDSAGRVTGVSVNGVPVAGRIATGPVSRTGGLVVSGIVAYRSLSNAGKIFVTYKVHDVSYKAINSSPAALATFSGYSEDDFNSVDVSTLAPGVTTYGYGLFGTTKISGPFELRSNDGYNRLLASSTLHKVR